MSTKLQRCNTWVLAWSLLGCLLLQTSARAAPWTLGPFKERTRGELGEDRMAGEAGRLLDTLERFGEPG